MEDQNPVIEINDLHRSYGKVDAVNGLNLNVPPGRCYGLFGRNGAGKTTTLHCMLNLLRPKRGEIKLFGLCPRRDEVSVKSRLAWVPDSAAFYPWMKIGGHFRYVASLRQRWNSELEKELMDRFELDLGRKVTALSRGEKMQVALIAALCPEPELLLLDEPTTGLDPLMRKDVIKTVIGSYLDAEPEKRTVLVSTHLLSEFEGLIDEFTIIEKGRDIVTSSTEAARRRFTKFIVRFPHEVRELSSIPCLYSDVEGRVAEIYCEGNTNAALELIKRNKPEDIREENLRLEEIFRVWVKAERKASAAAMA